MSLEPTDAENIADALNSKLLDLHTAIPGRVVTYNPVLQVADVEIIVRNPLETADGSILHEEFAVVPNVKVRWPRGGGFSIHFPLAEGDHVLLIFCEASIAMWRETGQPGEVGDLRRHDLSHAIALPGIEPDDDPIPVLDAIPGTVCFNGPGVWRFGSAAADFAAHATSTNAAISALQAQIAALQTEAIGFGAYIAALTAAFAANPTPPGYATTAAAMATPGGTVVTLVGTATSAIGSGTAAVSAQQLLIPSTKLKAE